MHVSRETEERLRAYMMELLKWNTTINLIAKSTLSEAWTRHVLDSAQAFEAAGPGFTYWCDLGAGAGLPGLVAAIIAREREPAARFMLIESDARKSAFLKIQIDKFGLNAQVEQRRIEDTPPCSADIVSARALAPLNVLLGYAHRHLSKRGAAIFLKGRSHQEEVEFARRTWQFDLERRRSQTDAEGCVLIVRNLRTQERQP